MIKKLILCFTPLLLVFLHIDFSTVKAAGNTVQVAVHKANIRSEPSNTASVIAQVGRNERFPVLQEKFGWYEVQLPSGGKGWVAGYIVTNSSYNSGSANKKGTVIADRLHVRSHPSLSANIIGKLHTGDQVTVTGESNDWANITYNNQSGWISKQFIRFAGAGNTNKNGSPGGFAYITTDKTNLRADADTSAPVITKGSPGERYPIIGQDGDWYKITLASGREAYVASWVVSPNKTSAPSKTESDVKSVNKTPGLSGKTIILDAGHGGYDPGAATHSGIPEKELTMKTAQRLQQKLSAAGANVILTRAEDRYVTLDSRASASNNHQADAFISLHYDSSTDAGASGVTAYYHHGNQHGLASTVNQVMNSSLSLNNRGTRFGDYHVIRENSRPATLLELGYLSNPYEGQYVTTDSYQEVVSNSIYDGLQSYFNQ